MKLSIKRPRLDWSWFPKKAPKKVATPKPAKFSKLKPKNLTPEGHVFHISWPTVPGASKALVDQGELRFQPLIYRRNIGQVDTTSANGNTAIDIDLKAPLTLGKLHLNGLKSGNVTLAHESDASSRGWRLLLSAQLEGAWVPLYAVNPVWKRGAIPAMLTGASFNSHSLNLPGKVRAQKWRLEIVEGSNIESFNPRAISLTKATGTILQTPEDPKVLGPNDQELWSHTGSWSSAEGVTSLKVPLEHALQDALDQGQAPLAVSYRMTGAQHSRIHLANQRVRGHLLREHTGVWEHRLEGDPATLDFDPALADERPSQVSGDLTLTYLGIRLLDLPANPSFTSDASKTMGRIITENTTVVDLPNQLFGVGQDVLSPARLGMFGRAVAACELVVKFRDRTSGKTVGEPAALDLAPSPDFQQIWFHFPDKPFQAQTLQLEITAPRGRFYWVGGNLQTLRFAVYDPKPGNRPVFLNNTLLTRMSESSSHQPGFQWPEPAFRGAAPKLSSHLFLKAEITDLQMRYAR